MSKGRGPIQRPPQPKPKDELAQPSISVHLQQNHLNLIQQTALDPDTLGRLHEIKPAFADALVAAFSSQVAHRQAMERAPHVLRSRGQVFGFICALLMIGSGIYMVAHDKARDGAWLIGVPTLGIAGAFYYERREQGQPAAPGRKK